MSPDRKDQQVLQEKIVQSLDLVDRKAPQERIVMSPDRKAPWVRKVRRVYKVHKGFLE
jgi:hypothetical protein